MKIRCSLFAGILVTTLSASAQQPAAADSTGLPGDNFSLQGALDLFKQSIDLENFEKALNAETNEVNNLDLDGDGNIDYVRVTSHKEGDAVAVVMQVPISKDESQDVAVIELEKTGAEQAAVQIRGAEELYGKDVIVEPVEQKEQMKDGKGPFSPELIGVEVYVNVWAWSPVPWFFSARYAPWDSPWYWGYYPPWWRPWHPHPWRTWWARGFRYHHWYHPVHTCRVVHAHAIYAPRPRNSAIVHARFADAHQRYENTRPAKQPATGPAARPNKNKAIRPARQPAPPKARPAAPSKAPRGKPDGKSTKPQRGRK